jgi:hypothetical protein
MVGPLPHRRPTVADVVAVIATALSGMAMTGALLLFCARHPSGDGSHVGFGAMLMGTTVVLALFAGVMFLLAKMTSPPPQVRPPAPPACRSPGSGGRPPAVGG